MPKLFRKKGTTTSGGGNDSDDRLDDMTIASSFSMGGSSVSDRIMGRMKINLGSSFGGSSRDIGASINTSSSRSIGSVGSAGGSSSRRRSRSKSSSSRFGSRRRLSSSAPSKDDISLGDSCGSGGRSKSARSRRSLLRSQSARKYRPSEPSSSVGVSSVGVPSMEDMDSSEAMALKGQSMGRRRRSSNTRRLSSNKSLGGSSNTQLSSETTIVEYSLTELRSMNEHELEAAMKKAGVPNEDITKTLNDVVELDRRKNVLVALFVNSGRVKLTTNNNATTVIPLKEGRPTIASTVSDRANSIKKEGLDDASSAGSTKGEEAKSTTKKTKLDKIAELKTENKIISKENQALKKTTKKLLGQLTDAIKEKGELQRQIHVTEKSKKKEMGDSIIDDNDDTAGDDGVPISSLDKSLQSIDEKEDGEIESKNTKEKDTKSSLPPDVTDEQEDGDTPPSAVNLTTNKSPSRRTSDYTLGDESSAIGSEKSASNTIIYLKRKLKKAKAAHEDTEFRLQAEIDILTKEVNGLQRELGLSLESCDSAKKRSSNVKHELKAATRKVTELEAEAEARDKLIETFSNILLQKIDSMGNGTAEEGKQLIKLNDVSFG